MKALKKILLDIVPVVFGVLIALFINSLKQSYDDQKFLDKMYATIAKEMETNTASVKEVLANHYAFMDSINAKMNKDVSIAEILQINLQKANIKNTGWHAFMNAKLELVDFEVITILSSLEENKQTLTSKFDHLRDYILTNLSSKEKQHKETMLLLVIDVIDSETSMINTQKKYLSWYEKQKDR